MATIHSLNNVTLRELGPSLISTNNIFSQTKYSYVEFSNGEMLKNVVVPHVLEGILTTSLDRGITTDLHFKKMGSGYFLFAAKKEDGKHFAMNPGQGSCALSFFFFMFMLLNIGIIAGEVYPLLIFTLPITFFFWWIKSINSRIKSFIIKLPNYHILN